MKIYRLVEMGERIANGMLFVIKAIWPESWVNHGRLNDFRLLVMRTTLHCTILQQSSYVNNVIQL